MLKSFRRGRRLLPLVTATVLGVGSAVAAPVGAAPARPAPFHDSRGLHVVGVQRIDARQYDVRLLSAFVGRPLHVRVLLPVDYDRHPQRRYPVLYLFHGTSGWASDWVESGRAEQTTAPYPVITVMPECGFDGDGGFWFTDWVDQSTSHGPSQFESYLIDQFLPWVDDNLRTIPQRRARAVAGLSQGGYGAAEMAARHPDLFTVMASFSGAPEIDRDPEVIAGATAVIDAIAVGDDGVPPDAIFGSRATDEINWQGHDPSTLIPNLRGMRIYLWTGAGAPGPYDGTPPNPGAVGIESLVHQSTLRFHQHLQQAGIPHFYDDYTYGTHSWGYWARDLRAFMKPMMAAFAHPTAPDRITYGSIDRQWTQWGWSVSVDRSAEQEFSAVEHADAHGFTFLGTGTADVVTPADYRPGEQMEVVVHHSGRSTRYSAVADDAGRVQLALPMGEGPPQTVRVQLIAVRR